MFAYRSRSFFPFHSLLKGACAGFVGTAPMTAVMVTGWQLLPADEKYPMLPRQIVGELTERLEIEDRMSEEQVVAATLFSHFSYGALFGSADALLAQRIPLPHSMKGLLAGFALLVGSYLGWLPAVGILPPATRHPWRRNLLMIVAHFVWGVTMGMALKKLNSERQNIDL
jgi:putative membrane protein